MLQYQQGLPVPTPTPNSSGKPRMAMMGFFTKMIGYSQRQPLPLGSTNMILPTESNTIWRALTRASCNIFYYYG